jgi:hypothetical protein
MAGPYRAVRTILIGSDPCQLSLRPCMPQPAQLHRGSLSAGVKCNFIA